MSQTEIIKTKIGRIKILFDDEYIYSAKFVNNTAEITNLNHELVSDIKNYFNGSSTIFLSKYKLFGTPFQKKVWKEIAKIPYGKTKTYGQIAKLIGSPNSYRAVANACGQNRIVLFVPCHRVVGQNNLGGYKWGSDKKFWLIDFEKN